MRSYGKHNEVPDASNQEIQCSKNAMRELLLQQWRRLTPNDLEETEYVKEQIAILIQYKYGIDSQLIENYLSNLERTLPVEI